MTSTYPRRPLNVNAPDDWDTPAKDVEPIIEQLYRHTTYTKVWEPCAGRGAMVDCFENATEGSVGHCFSVRGSDIEYGQDFLRNDWEGCQDYIDWCDVIVTNPPYKYKTEMLARCYEIGKPFALLLPITTLEGQTHRRLFDKYGVQVLFLTSRAKFVRPIWQEKKSAPQFATAWFTNGLNLPRELNYGKIEDMSPVRNNTPIAKRILAE